MKKNILLIAVAMLMGSQLQAQDLALATSPVAPLQLNLTEQADHSSIYTVPMPESDLLVNNQLNTKQYTSRKGWGIACIISGGLTMVSGISVWLGGDIFNNMASSMGDDPDMQEGQDAMNTVGNGVKTIGIVGAVAGAALVGTGIWLVSSDGGSSSGRRGHGRRSGHRKTRRRHADLFQQPTIEPDWGLSLNMAPTSAGLTLVF